MKKHKMYLSIAKTVSENSTCLRRKYGVVIVKDDIIISTGYNGSARKTTNCNEYGKCNRKEKQIAPGERYEECHSVHAEMNAMLSASSRDMIGATLYLVGCDADTGLELDYSIPCMMCRRAIINMRIKEVISLRRYLEGNKYIMQTYTISLEDLIRQENNSFINEEVI